MKIKKIITVEMIWDDEEHFLEVDFQLTPKPIDKDKMSLSEKYIDTIAIYAMKMCDLYFVDEMEKLAKLNKLNAKVSRTEINKKPH